MRATPSLQVSYHDLERLERMLEIHARHAGSDALSEELARAKPLAPASVPPDLVTMNSRVRYRDEESAVEREVTLVYPSDADVTRGRVSVLSPLGSALLGLSVGDTIEWSMPGGPRRIRVLAIPYQPEAAGDFDR